MMEAQLIEEQELLEYECSDGSQVIIATSEEVLSAAGLASLHHGAQILEVLHQGEDEEGNIILSTHNFTTGESGPPSKLISEQPQQQQPIDSEPEHSSPTEWCCTECRATFASKKALRFHSSVHVDEANYACEFCSASKIHWTEMWMHQCTNLESTPIVCPQCDTTVSTKKQLQVHEEVHDLQRRFKKRRMDGYFQRKLQEAEDPVVDWGAKPFICGVCGKPFGKLYEVEYHEKLHTGERSTGNNCDKCGMSYLIRHDLNKHLGFGCSGQLSRKTDAPFKRKSIGVSPSGSVQCPSFSK